MQYHVVRMPASNCKAPKQVIDWTDYGTDKAHASLLTSNCMHVLREVTLMFMQCVLLYRSPKAVGLCGPPSPTALIDPKPEKYRFFLVP
jgi:hypothetical protein